MSPPQLQMAEFVGLRYAALVRTAYLLTGHAQDAEDLVQSALVRTWARWSTIRDVSAVEFYVRRCMATSYVSGWRRRRGRPEVVTDTVPDILPAGPDEKYAAALEERSRLWPLLLELPPKQRAVLVLRFYEDLPDDQIADVLGCRVGTVRSQSSRALAKLRGRLEEDGSVAVGQRLGNGAGADVQRADLRDRLVTLRDGEVT